MDTATCNIKKYIIYVLMLLVLLFGFIYLNSYNSKKNEEKKLFSIQNLITTQEKIGLSQLLNISGYYLTNNGMYVNKFEDKVYYLIYEIRKTKPNNPKYFFCDANELLKITDLFESNINGNQTIKEIGLKIIKENREKCFRNNK